MQILSRVNQQHAKFDMAGFNLTKINYLDKKESQNLETLTTLENVDKEDIREAWNVGNSLNYYE